MSESKASTFYRRKSSKNILLRDLVQKSDSLHNTPKYANICESSGICVLPQDSLACILPSRSHSKIYLKFYKTFGFKLSEKSLSKVSCQNSVTFYNLFGVCTINLICVPLTEKIAVQLYIRQKRSSNKNCSIQ